MSIKVFTVLPFGSSASGVRDGLTGDVGDFEDFEAATEPVITGPGPSTPPSGPTRSLPSTRAFHSTIFEDFRLTATAYYNFFERDERTNTSQDPSAHVNEIARYIELRWNISPVLTPDLLKQPSKGIRVADYQIPTPIVSTAVAAGTMVNGYVSPGVISAIITDPDPGAPPPTFDEDAFLLSPSAGGLSAASHIDEVAEVVVLPPPRIVVRFIDPSIAGALYENRIEAALNALHLSALGAVAQITPALEVLSEFNQDAPPANPPPTVPAPSGTPTLVYAGYVIEKYKVDDSGSPQLIRQIFIEDPLVGSFIDREVVFEGSYAYKIRSIVQWSHPTDVGFSGLSDLDRERAFDPSGGASKVASYYGGDWSDWASAKVVDDRLPLPPDELTVRPISRRSLIDIVWKMPADPQRDVSTVVLLRAVEQGGKVGLWMELGRFPARNGRFVDRDVLPYPTSDLSYVYAMYTETVHSETSVLTEQVRARLREPTKTRELPLKQVAEPGADPFADPASARRVEREGVPVALQSATFYVRPATSMHPLFDRNYTVEVQSLSTGERATLDISVDSTDVDVGPRGASRTEQPLSLLNRREVTRGLQR